MSIKSDETLREKAEALGYGVRFLQDGSCELLGGGRWPLSREMLERVLEQETTALESVGLFDRQAIVHDKVSGWLRKKRRGV
jgi:hypothetical protein